MAILFVIEFLPHFSSLSQGIYSQNPVARLLFLCFLSILLWLVWRIWKFTLSPGLYPEKLQQLPYKVPYLGWSPLLPFNLFRLV